MPHYKTTNGNLHFIDDEYFEYLLPPESVKITDEEANNIRQIQKEKEENP